jgi:hypothetical protein
MIVGPEDLVRTGTGEVTTIAKLAVNGELAFSRSDRFATRNGKIRTAYFADMADGSGCWEISRATYNVYAGLAFGSDGLCIGGKDMSDGEFLAPLLNA